MTASTSNRISLRYVVEDEFGVVPDDTPNMSEVRLTGESLRGDASYVQSAEIRSDRQVPDVVRTGIGASGNIEVEWSLPTFQDFIAMALMADGASLADAWADQVDALSLTTVAITKSGNEVTFTKSGAFGSFTAKSWVYVSGCADAGNNGLFKVKTQASGAITVFNPAGVANASDGCSIRQAAQVVNGTTFRSMYLERQYNDLTNKIRPFTGMAIETWALSVSATAILTGSFGWMGKQQLAIASSTAGSGSPVAAPTDGVCNAVDHVQAVYESNSYNRFDITDFNFSMTNNFRQRMIVGTLGPISIGAGTIGITGGVDSFFEDEGVADDFVNDTPSMLAFTIDRGNYAMVIEFPRVKYESAEQTAGGLDQDIINAMTWRAYMHETELVSIRVGLVNKASS